MEESPANTPVVWLARLTDDPAILSFLRSLLSPEERARLKRFGRCEDHQRFVIGRGLLRLLLGAHLHLAPQDVSLILGPLGKPSVGLGGEKTALHFNLSHSGQLVVLAFHAAQEVGVDVEEVRRDLDFEALADHVFTPDERRDWERLNAEARRPAFLQAWTRHEARVKACGSGIGGHGVARGALKDFELRLPAGYQGALALNCVDGDDPGGGTIKHGLI
jgi:4'-phosphopantetheinyl transferase